MDPSLLEKLAARRRFGVKPGLDSIRALAAAIGDPQDSLRCVHIAGTNGKGATAAIVDSVLRAAGYSTARYTSPHLVRLNERFFLDGRPASDRELSAAAGRVFPAVEAAERAGRETTFFECLTAVAFELFARHAREASRPCVAILETGLGGRLDATNIVPAPLVAAITRIGLDHCAILGNTIEEIAREKAGIAKPGRPLVCGAMPRPAIEEIARCAARAGARPVVSAPEAAPVRAVSQRPGAQTLEIRFGGAAAAVELSLGGPFQAENASTALAILRELADCGFPCGIDAVRRGFASVVWPGRFQLAAENPPTVVDGAHNPDGAAALARAVAESGLPRPVCLVAGFCADKDVAADLREFAKFAGCAFAAPVDNPRSLPPRDAARMMADAGIRDVRACASAAGAISAARERAAAAGGSVVVCGSLFLAGEALQILDAFPWPSGPREPSERL